MSDHRSYSTDVTIVGAGVVGAACALALAQARPRTKILLLGEASRADQVVTLTPHSIEFLESLGLAPRALGQAVHHMEVFANHALVPFNAADAGLPALAWVVEQADLQAKLDEAITRAGIQRLAGAVSDLAPVNQGRSMSLNGEHFQVHTRLAVAADGGQSRLRELAAIETVAYRYPQRAVVAQVAIRGLARQDTAYQWFGPHGVLAFLPMRGERFCMIWSAPTIADHAVGGSGESGSSLQEALLVEDVSVFVKEYLAVVGSSFGEIELLSPRRAFDLKRLQPKRLIADRLVLMGDAAHVIHPLAGQGLNLGLSDAQALAQVLGHLPAAADVGEHLVLRRYERARAEPIALMSALTHGLQKVFEGEADQRQASHVGRSLFRLMRDIGWRSVGQIAPLRQAMIKRASA